MSAIQNAAETFAAFFRERGVNAAAAWPETAWNEDGQPLLLVELKHWEGGPAGLQDYLGQRWNQEKQTWEELYGKKAEAVLGLGLYGTTAEECLSLLEEAAEALRRARPEGWTVKRLTCGETAYDQDCGRFVRRGELTAEAFLYAIADEAGAFLEFEVRGERIT